ncbi:MAG TPA: adenylosuccinate synthase [Anaerolineae bacterium]|nr:adenylosuccinate synthase [Anaerolineae bacterium]
MPVTVVVGAQWGDEGKGRIVDYLAARADLVIRFQGGDNAGHTVVNEHGRFALHLIPCGIFYPHVLNILGAGTVVNLETVALEVDDLVARGVDTANLWIDHRAHLIWPYHRLLDGAEEERRKAEVGEAGEEMGTTRRGIGPVYADKHAYNGIRAGDLHHPDLLRGRIDLVLPFKNRELGFYGLRELTVDDLMDLATTWRVAHGARIVDTLPWVRDAVRASKSILLEGQLGIGRDIDWGIYPYTTSSSPTAGGACVGAGIPPRAVEEVLGVVKAYSTSVGGGPFPTELFDEQGAMLQEIGREFGATTGRQRRCGWFDGMAIGYAGYLNGFTGIAVTKLDVLDHFDELKLCTGYRLGADVIDHVPDTATLAQVEPIYESWPGWRTDTSGCREWNDLPPAAQSYLRRIEALAGAPIRFVSVGPERSQIVVVEK